MMHRLASLETPIVRDLAYACFDQPLIKDFAPFFTPHEEKQLPSNCHLSLNEERMEWLYQLDKNPQPLAQHLHKKTQTRLGYYYESLWHFFIQQDPTLKLIANNHKIYEGKRTLGEIDIVYQCLHSRKYYHLELAVKFYMQTGKYADANEHYYGSNQRDRFDLKLSKLLNHQSQFCIGQHQNNINHLWNKEVITNEIALRGFLFYPLGQQQNNQTINPLHNRGEWLPLFKIDQIIDTYDYWAPLQRLKWISPSFQPEQKIYHKNSIKYYLQQYIENIDDCLMIAGLKQQANGLMEQQRYMITPNNWADNIYYKTLEY